MGIKVMPYKVKESDKVIAYVDGDYKDFDSLEEYINDCDLCERPLEAIERCDEFALQLPKAEDIELNVCKTKHLTNTRSSSADEALTLVPPRILSLEQALDFIDTDELLEVTPQSLRIRKRILDPTMRKRAEYARKNG